MQLEHPCVRMETKDSSDPIVVQTDSPESETWLLEQLEEATAQLRNPPHNPTQQAIHEDLPLRISTILNSVSTLTSRAKAERMLASGVNMWNAIIGIEGSDAQYSPLVAIKIRHLAVDCMYMSTAALGGLSARYEIDELTLLRFYSLCGRKYAREGENLEMASVCFERALEFKDAAEECVKNSEATRRLHAKAMFDLLLGKAEYEWSKSNFSVAEHLVHDSSEFLVHLPEEIEFLASVQFNFGVFAYESKNQAQALQWVQKSIATRDDPKNPNSSAEKQSKAARLAAMCLIDLNRHDEALVYVEQADHLCNDAVCTYLMLKLRVLRGERNLLPLAQKIWSDPKASLDVCMASVALLSDCDQLSAARAGYEAIVQRFCSDPIVLLQVVGPRYLEVLCGAGDLASARRLVELCVAEWPKLRDTFNNSDGSGPSLQDGMNKWSCIALNAGAAFADRALYGKAVYMLEFALETDSKFRHLGSSSPATTPSLLRNAKTVVQQNEFSITRLISSCALLALGSHQKPGPVDSESAAPPEGDGTSEPLYELAIKFGKRAKSLDPSDGSARLLVIKCLVLRRNHEEAMRELLEAAKDIENFDVGTLADAACDARDNNSWRTVVRILRLIVVQVTKDGPANSNDGKSHLGGAALTSAVGLLLDSPACNDAGLEEAANDAEPSWSAETETAVLEVLEEGIALFSNIDPEDAYPSPDRADSSLSFLEDVAWNLGRGAARHRRYEAWSRLFEACCALSSRRRPTPDTRKTQLISIVMVGIDKRERLPNSSTSNGSLNVMCKDGELTLEIYSHSPCAFSSDPYKERDCASGGLLGIRVEQSGKDIGSAWQRAVAAGPGERSIGKRYLRTGSLTRANHFCFRGPMPCVSRQHQRALEPRLQDLPER